MTPHEAAAQTNVRPTVSVTSPATGATYSAGAAIPFSATASDADGTITWVGFYVDSVLRSSTTSRPYSTSLSNLSPGSHTLTAIAWDNKGAWTQSAPRTVTVSSSTSGNRPPSVAVTSPTTGATYSAGAAIPFSATASDPDGTITWVGFYVDSVLRTSTTSSPYSTSLSNLATGVHTLTAIAWDNKGTWTQSAPRTVTVSSSTSGNRPPSVAVTSPTTGATYSAGATIPFSATASDADGTITWVGFYVDSVLRSSTTSNPYSTSLSNLATGVHTLTAIAWDNKGTWTQSAPTTVTIGSSGSSGTPSNAPPVVSLSGPAAGTTFTAPASMTVSANASDVNGTITQVSFYANGTLLGTDTTSPYSFSWTNVTAANYALTAVARDNAGATTVSSTRDISVIPAGLPRTAIFIPSSNHASAVTRYVLEIFTAGANPTVSNPVATSDLGKPPISNGECRADIAATILALPPGNYIATVTAMGSAGSTQSAPSPQFRR